MCITGAAAAAGVAVGDPLAGPDPAGAAARPAGAAQHSHTHSTSTPPAAGPRQGPGRSAEAPHGARTATARPPARTTCVPRTPRAPTHAAAPTPAPCMRTQPIYGAVAALWCGHVASPDGAAGAWWRRRGGASATRAPARVARRGACERWVARGQGAGGGAATAGTFGQVTGPRRVCKQSGACEAHTSRGAAYRPRMRSGPRLAALAAWPGR